MKLDNSWIKERVKKALLKAMREKGLGTYEEMYRALVRAGYNQSFTNFYHRIARGTDSLGWFLKICEYLGVDGIKLLNEEVFKGGDNE